MNRQAWAEETSTIFHSIIHTSLVHNDWEWLPQLRFADPVEQAFLQYYRIWARHWKFVAAILFGLFLLMQLLITLAFRIPIFNADILLELVFQLTLLITLVLRIRFRYAFPLMLVLCSTILLIGTNLPQYTIPIQYIFQIITITMVGTLVSILLEYDARRDFLGQVRIHRIATTDLLSQTLSRHAFFERGTLELKRATRYQNDLSLLLIDIDHFKEINDQFGHLIGDQVIANLGEQLRLHIRPYDLVGRIGGEEFAILLPNTNLDAAMLIAERLRILTAQLHPVETLNVTISIGVAPREATDTILQDLIGRADQCLYMAKRSGRNKVVQPTLKTFHTITPQLN